MVFRKILNAWQFGHVPAGVHTSTLYNCLGNRRQVKLMQCNMDKKCVVESVGLFTARQSGWKSGESWDPVTEILDFIRKNFRSSRKTPFSRQKFR